MSARAIGPLDLHLLAEGTHRELHRVLGAHPDPTGTTPGVRFAVFAPCAVAVSVVGDWNDWDARADPMKALGGSGVYEAFVPDAREGSLYKFEIRAPDGSVRTKADPFAFRAEHPPATASRVFASRYEWNDAEWCRARRGADPLRSPISIYEVHPGSFMRHDDGRVLGYIELAERLIPHVKSLGFTHIELMPIMEHPFDGSWGYQVTGYYAPTARFGDPDQFRTFVDLCHQADLGVILDWVPAHFPRDDFALRRFDGTPVFEYADTRIGEHAEWGTLVFDYAKNEVRAFLIANALFWLEEYHVDGLRVDAVASMLYRDYGRAESDWLPNQHGGPENLEAVRFLRELNTAIAAAHPGCFTAAEESTAWPGVTHPVSEGGLGFTFKWNMGWMHDSLRYFARDAVYRGFHQHELTFAALYEHTEHFVMPLSHDEVVHEKRSLFGKMAGDDWQRHANLRILLAYLYARPGKKLLFMGTELAPETEWDFAGQLDWARAETPVARGTRALLAELGKLYRAHPALYRSDPEPEGFRWIACDDTENSVLCFLRRFADDLVVVVMNNTPVPRPDYRIGLPQVGRSHGGVWRELLDTDATAFGGSGHATLAEVRTEPVPLHGYARSARLTLPPLGVLFLAPRT